MEVNENYYYYLISPVIKFLKNKGVIIKPKLGMYGKHS